MPEIKWKLDLTVTDGPKFAPGETMKVDAYERIEFELRPNYDREVEIEPDKNLCLMMIQRSAPDPKYDKPTAEKLTYTLSGLDPIDSKKEITTGPIPLESVHLLIGSEVHRLMKVAPTKLNFTNKQDQAVTITVLLGRRVAEESPILNAKSGKGSNGAPVSGKGDPSQVVKEEPSQSTQQTGA